MRWTCESCKWWDDGYCCLDMTYTKEDDYCDKWGDAYDDDDGSSVREV